MIQAINIGLYHPKISNFDPFKVIIKVLRLTLKETDTVNNNKQKLVLSWVMANRRYYGDVINLFVNEEYRCLTVWRKSAATAAVLTSWRRHRTDEWWGGEWMVIVWRCETLAIVLQWNVTVRQLAVAIWHSDDGGQSQTRQRNISDTSSATNSGHIASRTLLSLHKPSFGASDAVSSDRQSE